MGVAVGGRAAAFADDDLAGLYRLLSGQLEQLVRLDVQAPEPVIEDACQFAWSRLVVYAAGVRREAALSWLSKTAVREARKRVIRDGRECSLDAALESGAGWLCYRGNPAPEELLELRERLDSIAELSHRQQRLLWLHGIGLSYAEMASYTGCTRRTVERQLLRAKRRMRMRSTE